MDSCFFQQRTRDCLCSDLSGKKNHHRTVLADVGRLALLLSSVPKSRDEIFSTACADVPISGTYADVQKTVRVGENSLERFTVTESLQQAEKKGHKAQENSLGRGHQ